ncbi:MAG: hypothetical protein K2N72_06440 [Oscillospiraceae bacterium]|nr:hypothetical protein [Oscillospiraceae bacterium]
MNIYDETQKITSKDNAGSMGTLLLWFVDEALKQNAITIYEAFELMEMYDRFEHSGIRKFYFSEDVVLSMNMALMAKLFNENALYEQYCSDARERLDFWFGSLKKNNNGKLPKGSHYILDDLEGFLTGNSEHMKKLSSVRKHARRNNPGENVYHFESFPYDYLKYEDELIKILNGEADRYEVDKTISPEICDMMTAVELRAIELE